LKKEVREVEKKGQVAIFIILGIVAIDAIGFYVYNSQKAETEYIAPVQEDIVRNIPLEVRPIYSFV